MTVMTGPLDRRRDLLARGLRAAVERLDPSLRSVAAYHLGWCDRDGTPTEASSGKAIRPALALLAAEAVGGDAEPGLPGAVAVELVHNFSLLHDDLMDRDTQRRHRATVWAVWDDATAVLTGDAMLSLAHEVVDELDSPHAQRASLALARATRELVRGQMLDMTFERRRVVSLEECVDMAGAKTGSLLGVSVAIGALLAGAPDPVADAFGTYGYELGVAFQLVDDLLGIWGAPEQTGKPVFSDLVARKKTLPLVWSLANGGQAGGELAEWLRTDHEAEEAELRRAADLIARAGGRDWAMAEATRRLGLAEQALGGTGISSEHRQEFADIARFVVERQL
jgi:geranylgeranyl diphosphate synthase type I